MSDYLFMMESRLSSQQWEAILQVQDTAQALGMNLYLVGGAIRYLMGGFPIDDLDFVVEGNSLKLARTLARQGVRVDWENKTLRAAEMEFSSGVLASVGMARTETYTKPGSPSEVAPAPIVAHLKRRDFSINAIGVSLNPHSRGLLLDPTNGVADIEKKEIRTLHSYSFFDDPIRLFRAVRFLTRLHYSWEAKTALQFQNARSQELATKFFGDSLALEMRQIARERDPAEILKALEKDGLLQAVDPRLRKANVNWPLLAKASKGRQLLAAAGIRALSFVLFLLLLLRKLPPRDRIQLVKQWNLNKAERGAAQRLETDAKRLVKQLTGKEATTPVKLYLLLAATPPDVILLTLIQFPQRKVQSRIRAYLQKFLPLRSSLPEKELQGLGVAPGTDRYRKILDAYFYELLGRKLRTRSQQMKFLITLAQGSK